MKKMKRFFAFLFVFAPLFLYAKGNNVLSQLEGDVNSQITEAGASIASMIQTFTMVVGVLWFIVMCIIAYLNMEMIKTHAKSLFGAGILIGVIYGLAGTFT